DRLDGLVPRGGQRLADLLPDALGVIDDEDCLARAHARTRSRGRAPARRLLLPSINDRSHPELEPVSSGTPAPPTIGGTIVEAPQTRIPSQGGLGEAPVNFRVASYITWSLEVRRLGARCVLRTAAVMVPAAALMLAVLAACAWPVLVSP